MGDEHTMPRTDDVSQNCTRDTYVILLTNVTPIHVIKKETKNHCMFESSTPTALHSMFYLILWVKKEGRVVYLLPVDVINL